MPSGEWISQNRSHENITQAAGSTITADFITPGKKNACHAGRSLTTGILHVTNHGNGKQISESTVFDLVLVPGCNQYFGFRRRSCGPYGFILTLHYASHGGMVLSQGHLISVLPVGFPIGTNAQFLSTPQVRS